MPSPCATTSRARPTTTMTTQTEQAPTPPASAGAGPEDGQVRRLHPMSWLFVLLQQLKQFVVPLLVLVFLGRGDRNQLWSLVAVGGFAVVAVWRYLTFRYRITAASVVKIGRASCRERVCQSVLFSVVGLSLKK